MNGQPTANHSTTNSEQSIGKFHVVNVDKSQANQILAHDESNPLVNQQQPPPISASSTTTDESACPSRFQMIRVDRNFVRGRWKVNDYEPPENISSTTNPPVNNTTENEPVNIASSTTSTTIPTTIAPVPIIPTASSAVPPVIYGDNNVTSSATLAATAACIQQQQQRLAMNNPATVVPIPSVPPAAAAAAAASLIPGYPPTALPNMAPPNQPYLLPNHPQLGYYQFLLPTFAQYAAQWAALAAATNSFMPQPMPATQPQASQLPSGNLGDPLRPTETVPDMSSENPAITSNIFSNPTLDHLLAAQIGAPSGPFLYTPQHPHSAFVSQQAPNTASAYATMASYPPTVQSVPIVPSTTRPNSFAQTIPSNPPDVQQQQQQQAQPQQPQQAQPLPQQQQQSQVQGHPVPPTTAQQPAPTLTSPKNDTTLVKNTAQSTVAPKTAVSTNTTTTTTTTAPAKPLITVANIANPDVSKITLDSITNTKSVPIPTQNISADAIKTTHPVYVPDLLSTSPASLIGQQPSQTLMSPITIQTTNPNSLQSPNKGASNSLNDIWGYTAANPTLNLAQTAQTAMGLLQSDNNQNTEIAHEILKELTTPTKQNNVADIDNKISAAMDLVKMHLQTAVREEVVELRQKIAMLSEKVQNLESENSFLRQHVSSEVYAQYIPPHIGSLSISDSSNSSTTTTTVTTTASSAPLSSMITSSQPIPTAFVSPLPPTLAHQSTPLMASQPISVLSQPSSTNLPTT